MPSWRAAYLPPAGPFRDEERIGKLHMGPSAPSPPAEETLSRLLGGGRPARPRSGRTIGGATAWREGRASRRRPPSASRAASG